MDLSRVNLRKNLSVCSKFWLCGRRLAQGGCEQGESGRRFCQSGQRFSLFQVHSTLGKTSPIYYFSNQIFHIFKGILHQKIFYRPNLIFWIVMGCGIARFGRRGLKTTET